MVLENVIRSLVGVLFLKENKNEMEGAGD